MLREHMIGTNLSPGDEDTIVALSTGQLPSGIAVIRLSGPQCSRICVDFSGVLPEPRKVRYGTISDPDSGLPFDRGFILWLPGHGSLTGEDCVEFQVHGSRAVVASLLDCLCRRPSVRIAEPGEFVRRAFLNGKMDLTEIEGLSDLIAAQTEAQRIQAYRLTSGVLRKKYEGWRRDLTRIRALIEAELDFTEEEDVPTEIGDKGFLDLVDLVKEIGQHLDDSRAGEIIREGYRIAILGRPNAGKSTLLNALAKREVAIVTDVPGTTRDVLEVHLDIGGYEVLVWDTAGIRDSSDRIEQEGIDRARSRAREADLVLWLHDINDLEPVNTPDYEEVLEVVTKDDEGLSPAQLSISVRTGRGLGRLISAISNKLETRLGTGGEAVLTRARHRQALTDCHAKLVEVISEDQQSREIQAEKLRIASDCLGRITGKIDVEDLLDVIFSEFCVGK